jgi:hypothetical protein
MKKIIPLFVFAVAFVINVNAQLPAYDLPKPAGWGSETFPLPPGFAKEITYSGAEDIRFTPGWAKNKSEQYWSYAFAWLVEGKQTLDEKILNKYMTAYYKGIYTVNLNNKPAPREGFTTANFIKRKTSTGDVETYEGTVMTLNYLDQQELLLNVRVHIQNVPSNTATVILFEVSPQPYTHAVWKELGDVIGGFRLIKK